MGVNDLRDEVKKAENWFVTTCKAVWGAIKFVLIQAWALVTTEGKTVKDWALDPWKLGGFALFALAAFGGVQCFQLAEKVDATKLSILAGLVGSAVTVGTFLFGQAKSNDASIRSSGQ